MRLSTMFTGSNAHARIQGVVPFAAADIIALLREFDLAPTWNKPAFALTGRAKMAAVQPPSVRPLHLRITSHPIPA